ncbi:D-3-phosphoglycerate dehydrogenase [Microbacterium resistens]|uniref:D-3-phosphoglycerate dehydrogenase n=1 Tax=Microbacterium resistens TaxID=156977 RepID=A0ABU1SCY2_9MICO|nr:2-hydroxyacid dehydrogenase [Microbacterium resistens]MDR6867470.1 D-3-phosphoglycerate dehydrogenase [Microbacterium resistens]
MIRVLAAGDRFIRASLLRAELDRSLPGAIEVPEIEFAWPDVPFGRVAEVDEAAGSEDELIAALAGATAIVTQLAPLTARVMDAVPELRFIAVSRGGPTNVNVEAARARGIQVANVPGRNGVATAEMTIGLALALMRRIPAAHESMMARTWRGDLYRSDAVGREVAGSVIGLLGAGAVGSHVARAFAAMGAHVVVFDPYLPAGALDAVAERVDSIEDVFTRSDLVSVHARLTPDTAHMVNADTLARMRPGALLVNAARGGLVDYDAVAESLQHGHLGGAAFDVYPEEPVDFDHALFRLAHEGKDVVVTPHIAGASQETAVRAARGVAEEVRRFLHGEDARNPLVNGTRAALL